MSNDRKHLAVLSLLARPVFHDVECAYQRSSNLRAHGQCEPHWNCRHSRDLFPCSHLYNFRNIKLVDRLEGSVVVLIVGEIRRQEDDPQTRDCLSMISSDRVQISSLTRLNDLRTTRFQKFTELDAFTIHCGGIQPYTRTWPGQANCARLSVWSSGGSALRARSTDVFERSEGVPRASSFAMLIVATLIWLMMNLLASYTRDKIQTASSQMRSNV